MPISKDKKTLEGYCVPQVTIKKCCTRYLYNTITESNWGFPRRCKNRYELRNRDSLVWIFFSFSYCCCLYTIIRYWGQTSTFPLVSSVLYIARELGRDKQKTTLAKTCYILFRPDIMFLILRSFILSGQIFWVSSVFQDVHFNFTNNT